MSVPCSGPHEAEPTVSLGTQASLSADFSLAVANDEHGQELRGQGERSWAISSQLPCYLGTRFWSGSVPPRLHPLPDCPSSQAQISLGSITISPFLVPSVLGVETSLCCCEVSGVSVSLVSLPTSLEFLKASSGELCTEFFLLAYKERVSTLYLNTARDQSSVFVFFTPISKIKMYLRMELIFRVQLLHAECYARFIILLPHDDFVRKVVMPTFRRGWA